MPDDTDDALDENGLLRPGRTRRVSVMDSLKARGFVVTDEEREDDEPEGEELEAVQDSVLTFADADRRPGGPYVVDHPRQSRK